MNGDVLNEVASFLETGQWGTPQPPWPFPDTISPNEHVPPVSGPQPSYPDDVRDRAARRRPPQLRVV